MENEYTVWMYLEIPYGNAMLERNYRGKFIYLRRVLVIKLSLLSFESSQSGDSWQELADVFVRPTPLRTGGRNVNINIRGGRGEGELIDLR